MGAVSQITMSLVGVGGFGIRRSAYEMAVPSPRRENLALLSCQGIISDWLKASTVTSVVATCRIPPPANVNAIRVFVLGRNFARFSDDAPKDNRAAWGCWPQVIRLLSEKCDWNNPLESLFQLLQDDTMEGRLPLSKIPEQTITLHSLSIKLSV